jgi:hypothetical protein
MSEDFPSSNPFRRKGTVGALPAQSNASDSHDALAHLPPHIQISTSTDVNKTQKKPVKKVRVQSPPPSSPERDPIPHERLTSTTRNDETSSFSDDPFDNPRSDFSDASEAEDTNVKTKVPANPFQKTLATLEHKDDVLPSVTTVGHGRGAGKQSLDVEAFKRLLMTGNAGITDQTGSVGATTYPPAITTTPQIHVGHMTLGLNDGGNSTDTSSISRQSIFETIQEIHLESPRTSHEVSDPDDERRRVVSSTTSISDRKKPAPPGSRHGKLIKVELKGDGALSTKLSVNSAPQENLSTSQARRRSQSPKDLNKPLPPAPARASYELDRESIFDKEAAGKIPEPPSPLPRRKTPPAPPLARRRSQLVSSSKLSQTPTGRLSPNIEEDRPSLSDRGTLTEPSAANKAPPPPPRRPNSTKNPSNQTPSPSPIPSSSELDKPPSKSTSAPLPPPARTLSLRHLNRPPSVISMDGASKRSSIAPPPPPPPRQRASSRNSIEAPVLSPGSLRTSGDNVRRSLDSARDEPAASQPVEAKQSDGKPSQGANDILADLTALQREVDALRGQYEKRSVS